MQAIIFIGIPASGKSSFYKERFFRTHVRINLDMLRTRRRERILLAACLEAKQPFVVDNTNVTREERARYIAPAKAAGIEVIGYYFQSQVKEAIARNSARPEGERIPPQAIWGKFRKLEMPTLQEGFDILYDVRLSGSEFLMTQRPMEERDVR